jgi:hypothetical protein
MDNRSYENQSASGYSHSSPLAVICDSLGRLVRANLTVIRRPGTSLRTAAWCVFEGGGLGVAPFYPRSH